MKLLALLCLLGASALAAPLNILLFTADDMNFDSSGVYGGPIKGLTPHIDQLAA
jgi:arylsulfatase A-like enzyme